MNHHSFNPGERGSSSDLRPKGFTLIELLTVIAILGILAAVIIPSVYHVRTHAARTASASNLRQWSGALLLYLSENNHKIPYEGSYDQPSWSQVRASSETNAWFNVLPPLADSKPLKDLTSTEDRAVMIRGGSIFSSPGVDYDERENRRRPFFSYMMNSQLYSDEGEAVSNSGTNLIRVTLLPNPSRTIFITETRVSLDDGSPNEDEDRVARAKGRNNSISFRYNDQTNVAFLDGHVATVDSETLYNSGRDPSTAGGQLDEYIWHPW
ncbi:MAG: type II secretion system protein [Puniceicoccales bacterium]